MEAQDLSFLIFPLSAIVLGNHTDLQQPFQDGVSFYKQQIMTSSSKNKKVLPGIEAGSREYPMSRKTRTPRLRIAVSMCEHIGGQQSIHRILQ